MVIIIVVIIIMVINNDILRRGLKDTHGRGGWAPLAARIRMLPRRCGTAVKIAAAMR